MRVCLCIGAYVRATHKITAYKVYCFSVKFFRVPVGPFLARFQFNSLGNAAWGLQSFAQDSIVFQLRLRLSD